MADKISGTDPASDKRLRSAYLGERIRTLRAEVKALGEERSVLAQTLRTTADRQSSEAKASRLRRLYLSIRPAEARAEIARAMEERRGLTATDNA